MKKNKPALKPCPCCGSEVELSEGYDETDHYICWIECPNCHLSTRLFDSPPSALWNSRPIVSGDGVMIKLEKRVYDVLLKRNADLMDENDRLKKALFFSIEYLSVQKASLKQALDNVESDIEKLKRFREDLVKGWKE
jgi:hypothetical protein